MTIAFAGVFCFISAFAAAIYFLAQGALGTDLSYFKQQEEVFRGLDTKDFFRLRKRFWMVVALMVLLDQLYHVIGSFGNDIMVDQFKLTSAEADSNLKFMPLYAGISIPIYTLYMQFFGKRSVLFVVAAIFYAYAFLSFQGLFLKDKVLRNDLTLPLFLVSQGYAITSVGTWSALANSSLTTNRTLGFCIALYFSKFTSTALYSFVTVLSSHSTDYLSITILLAKYLAYFTAIFALGVTWTDFKTDKVLWNAENSEHTMTLINKDEEVSRILDDQFGRPGKDEKEIYDLTSSRENIDEETKEDTNEDTSTKVETEMQAGI